MKRKLIFLACLAGAFWLTVAEARATPAPARVSLALSEFDYFDVETDIRNLKIVLEEKLEKKLGESQGIKVEKISSQIRRRMSEDAWARTSYKYLLTGEFRNLPKDLLSVDIRVMKVTQGRLTEVYTPGVLLLPADSASYVLFTWIDHLALKVRGLVEGAASPPFIYTYCFAVAGGSKADLEAKLPFKLKNVLEASTMGRRFRVMGFSNVAEAESVCGKSLAYSLGLYEYVIEGDISPGPSNRQVVVAVTVRDGDRYLSIGSLTNADDAVLLASKLAELIARRWDSVIKP